MITRVILGEEPGKLFGPYEDDAAGVAWAVRNRHDSNYYVERGLCNAENNWYCSAKSNISGLNTTRALDTIGSLGNWSPWSSQYEAIAAYNRARSIAPEIMHPMTKILLAEMENTPNGQIPKSRKAGSRVHLWYN